MKQTKLPRDNSNKEKIHLNDILTTTTEISINDELNNNVSINIENDTNENVKTLLNSTYTKDEIKTMQYKSRLRKKFLGTYITDDIKFSKISLPCPAPGCKCNTFSNIFDNYENKIKHELLNN